MKNAHKRGDPGIFFIDSANNDSLLQHLQDYKIETTNPCLTGDTFITLETGEQRFIKDILPGDIVLTHNLTVGGIEPQKSFI